MVSKYIFVILCAICGVVRSITIKQLKDQEETCLAQHPTITKEILDSIRSNVKTLSEFYKDHPDLYCYTKCFMQGIKVYSESGVIDPVGMKELVHLVAIAEGVDDTTAIVHDAVEKCVMETGSDDHCEKIGHYFVCKVAALDGFKLNKEYCPNCYGE